MLTYVAVDGFRSLSHFEINIRPGLNILVGPNGSGKSNIISFFQFLSRLMSAGLSDAVSMAGGAGAFFQKIGEKSFQNEIHVVTRGKTYVPADERAPAAARNRRGGGGWVEYEYQFSIQASDIFDTIIFSQQKISLRGNQTTSKEDGWVLHEVLPIGEWDVVVRSTAEPPEVRISKLSNGAFFQIRPRMALARSGAANEATIEQLSEMLQMDDPGLQSTPLLTPVARFLDAAHFIIEDLLGGETLNINPAKVKEPEDTANEPRIRSDGSGLAATLWHMTNAKPIPRFYGWSTPYPHRRRRWPPEIYGQLQSLIQLVNSQIQKVFVENDPFDNQLKTKIQLVGEKGTIDLPLSAMSDGTIKWMSMITAVLTSRTIFAIEEPENFLHPLMLIEILKLMRATTSDKFSFAIMTTHSETLLNAASPDEIVVVSMEHGVTRGRRPADPENLAKEISETGFGLGHYYLIGALTDA
jgi:ABC-type cobalamin/Fe3+-siderophores transport system ATPase subunit